MIEDNKDSKDLTFALIAEQDLDQGSTIGWGNYNKVHSTPDVVKSFIKEKYEATLEEKAENRKKELGQLSPQKLGDESEGVNGAADQEVPPRRRGRCGVSRAAPPYRGSGGLPRRVSGAF